MDNSEGNSQGASEETESKILCFSKDMLPCKLAFLTMDTCFSCAFSFQMLFYKSAGMTMTQIGLGMGINGLSTLPATTVWGSFIDSVTKYRALLYTSLCLMSAVTTCFVPWLLKLVVITSTVNTCFDNSTSHNQSLLLEKGVNCSTTIHLQNSNIVFIVMTSYGVLTSWINAGLYCYIEGSIVKAVFSSKTKQSYGQQKVFGPIGNALGNFIAGVAVDYIKLKHLPQFSVPFFVSIPFCLLIIPCLYLITRHTREVRSPKEREVKVSVKKQVLKVFRKCHNSIFLMSIVVAGLSLAMYSNFMFMFMYDVMQPTKTLMSLTTVVGTLSELTVYPFSSKLIKLFGGPIRCITFCMFIYSVRLVLLSFATSTWYVIAIQLLHGICTSLSWTAIVEQTWVIFPKDVTSTAIGILICAHFGAPNIIGNLLGGYLYNKYQGYRLFRGMAILSLMWGIFMIIYFEFKGKGAEAADRSGPIEFGVINEIDIKE